MQIKQEIHKLLDVAFIKSIQHKTSLTNIVSCKKEKCTESLLHRLQPPQEACPKDEFQLPNIDILMDAYVGHSMFFFTDGFSGHYQIRINPSKAKKITLRTPMGNFQYIDMSFGRKNIGTTSKCAMTTIFTIPSCFSRRYIADVVVDSREACHQIDDLRKVIFVQTWQFADEPLEMCLLYLY